MLTRDRWRLNMQDVSLFDRLRSRLSISLALDVVNFGRDGKVVFDFG